MTGYGMAYIVGNGIMQENIKEIEMDMSQDNDISALTEQQSNIRIKADLPVTLQACGRGAALPSLPAGFCRTGPKEGTAGTASQE